MFSAMLTISARTFARFSSTASTTINPSMVSMALFSAPGDANRTLKDDQTVLKQLEDQGIDRGRVTTVDTSKVDEALEVTDLGVGPLQDRRKPVCPQGRCRRRA